MNVYWVKTLSPLNFICTKWKFIILYTIHFRHCVYVCMYTYVMYTLFYNFSFITSLLPNAWLYFLEFRVAKLVYIIEEILVSWDLRRMLDTVWPTWSKLLGSHQFFFSDETKSISQFRQSFWNVFFTQLIKL